MTETIKRFSTSELLKFIENKQGIIFDLRPADAFNGWKLENEQRGGHIKTAKSLPFKWTNYMDWIEIVRSKHILPENKIIIYAYTQEDSYRVAKMFQIQ